MFKSIYMVASLCITSSAFAGLLGEMFHLSSEATDSPFVPGGQFEDFGDLQVIDGVEWTRTYPVYDFQQLGAPIIGEYTYMLDVGDDYIEMTASWRIYVDPDVKNPYESYFSLLPGDFYGFHLNFENQTNISLNRQLQVTSANAPVVHMGDLNLFENLDPMLEGWVDAQHVAPMDPSRISVGDTSLDINMQGLTWGLFWCTQGVEYTETARIDLEFDCPADISGDGMVDVQDILELISAWGPCNGCDEDIDGNGDVNVADLLNLIGFWGNDCP
tara:strand:- start:3829 stop:4647 length:819 start_codon:yes stop_codon:yes gene_type:complete